MKVLVLLLFVAVLSACNSPKVDFQLDDLKIIPMPQTVELGTDNFILSEKIVIVAAGSNQMKSVAALLTQDIKKRTGLDLKIENSENASSKKSITLKLSEGTVPNANYKLQISNKNVTIEASSAEGLFYGTQSLLQLLPLAVNNQVVLPELTIEDAPRYKWRGIMLDESRHFFGKDKVKQLLDMMALHKLNKFHWHLTDAPAWRLEIKKYPKLTSVGGKGSWSDPNTPVQFYTQVEIKEIVAYAADRFIEVIPEVDMPGHASAAIRAYPEYSGGGTEKHPDFTFNPGKTEVYGFLTDILNETKTLFPSKYVHIGGDEVSFGSKQWSTDPAVKKLMKAQKLKTLKEVEAYFVDRMIDTLEVMNKSLIGWDEIVEGDKLQKDAMVMWWRHDKVDLLKKSLDKGYQTVICPRIPYYFDFNQHESDKYGRTWGGFSDLKTGYEYPDVFLSTLDNKQNIIGLQANLWTERISTEKRFDYTLYPRISAFAEASWSQSEVKNYDAFLERLKPMLDLFEKENIYYSNPFDPASTPEPEGPQEPKWQALHK